MAKDKPGREIPKEYREVAEYQMAVHGWRYSAKGKGYPVLIPTDKTVAPIRMPKTPGDQRSLRNFIGQVRRSGGTWPPARGE